MPRKTQLWDNTYSWLATKQLSYSVQLRYPTGQSFEQERMQRCVSACVHAWMG